MPDPLPPCPLSDLIREELCSDANEYYFAETSTMIMLLMALLIAEASRSDDDHGFIRRLTVCSERALWPCASDGTFRFVIFGLLAHRLLAVGVRFTCSWPSDACLKPDNGTFTASTFWLIGSGHDATVSDATLDAMQAVLPLFGWLFCYCSFEERDMRSDRPQCERRGRSVVAFFVACLTNVLLDALIRPWDSVPEKLIRVGGSRKIHRMLAHLRRRERDTVVEITTLHEPLLHHTFLGRALSMVIFNLMSSPHAFLFCASAAVTIALLVAGPQWLRRDEAVRAAPRGGGGGGAGGGLLRAWRCVQRVAIIFVVHAFFSRVIFLACARLALRTVREYERDMSRLCEHLRSGEAEEVKAKFEQLRGNSLSLRDDTASIREESSLQSPVSMSSYRREAAPPDHGIFSRVATVRLQVGGLVLLSTSLYILRDALNTGALQGTVDASDEAAISQPVTRPISLSRHVWHIICIAYVLTNIQMPLHKIQHKWEASLAEAKAFKKNFDFELEQIDALFRVHASQIELKRLPAIALAYPILSQAGGTLSTLFMFNPMAFLKGAAPHTFSG